MNRKYFNSRSERFCSDEKPANSGNEQGSAIIIALLVMVLLLGFVALAVTRTTNETIASSNDAAESRAFEAAQASLEIMTRNFDKIFELKLNPDTNDLNNVKNQKPPGFDAGYEFEQNIIPTQTPQQVVMAGGEYQGLIATRDEWQFNTTATDLTNGVQVALRRRFYNNRIPIFQFGIFYDDDLEFHPGPRFDFGGRVHSNANIFLMASTGLYFSSKVTATQQVISDVARNGNPWTDWGENVFIKNASGSYVKLTHDMGSVLQSPANGTPVFADASKPEIYNLDMPTVYKNSAWKSKEALFQGNLLAEQKPLELPIRIASSITNAPLDYVELIKRGKAVGDLYNDGTGVLNPNIVPVTAATADTDITKKERYYNKTGIRVSLADSKAKLPGCASGVLQTPVATECGVQLNAGTGYTPLPMTDGYQATEINGQRFSAGGREVWIKVEAVGVDPVTNTFQEPRDITKDILSLGVTQPPPNNGTNFSLTGYGSCLANDKNPDCRSVIKLQRFNIEDQLIAPSGDAYMTSATIGSINYNYVPVGPLLTDAIKGFGGTAVTFPIDAGHGKAAKVNNVDKTVVAFPINMFDTREGLYNESINTGTTYPSGAIPWSGVMSMVDIDVANLKKFLDGTWDNKMPVGTPFAVAAGRTLKSTDIPDANGWVFYISDRRGDRDFDGEYDMEDIYGNNDGILQIGEDVDTTTTPSDKGTLQSDISGINREAARYTKDLLFNASPSILTTTATSSYVQPSVAATLEHQYYRRGIRLINGQTLPGKYDKDNPGNTKGFTVASENGVYVYGNYNAYGINSVGTPTPSSDYLPQNTAAHIPASIAADAITILSNKWNDGESFKYPFSLGNRDAGETFVRFAMLAGDARSSKNASPNQGGGNPRMTGGVHNFKRFLEDWSGVRLNYAGSLINLYNSRNNNGAFKCCAVVYSPPTRNWVFDTTFLDPNRLPPGTPFFQTIQLTGFQRLN
jgi:hypothetical protein